MPVAFRFALALALTVALFLLPTLAAAQERRVAIHLEVPRESIPDVVCVAADRLESELHASCSFGAGDSADRDTEAARCRSMVSEARDAVSESNQAPECMTGPPEAELPCADNLPPRGRQLACALNSQFTSSLSSRRLLVLDLKPGPYSKNVVPTLRGVTLNGQDVVLRVTRFGSAGAEAAAHLWVYGGSYEGGNAAVALRDGDHVSFALTPRLVQRRVQLPPSVNLSSTSLQWTARGGVRDYGTVRWTESPSITLPARSTKLDVSSPHFDARATWTSAEPPQPIEPRLTRLTFSWAPHCLYDPDLFHEGRAQGCPEIRLPAAGDRCSHPVVQNGVCRYECKADSQEGIRLPTRVEFSADRSEAPEFHATWHDELHYVGEVLRGYVAPQDRQLRVQFPAWPTLTETIGERVYHLLLLNRGEHAIQLKPLPGKSFFVAAPDLSCGNMVISETKGDLRYLPALAHVGGDGVAPGSIVVDPPKKHLDEIITLGFATSAGLSKPYYADAAGTKWFVMIEPTARINFRAMGKWRHATALEVRLSFLFGWLWAQGLDIADAAPVHQSAGFVRSMLTAHGVFSLTSQLSLGLGGGVSYARPLYNQDLDIAPSQISPVLPSIIFTYRASRAFAVELRGLLALEHSLGSTLDSYGAKPKSTEDWFVSAFGGIGLRFDL
jgi:hypothetical protein